MKVSCRDRERAIRSEDPELLEAVSVHARACSDCARELAGWRALAAAAPSLKKSWDSPRLWPQIREALERESQRGASVSSSSPSSPSPSAASASSAPGVRWLPIAAMAALFAIATAGLWVFRNSGGREPLTQWQTSQKPLLTDQAMDEVEAAEKTYVASIEKLSRLAQPRLAESASPLMSNYREKLGLLDNAIAELKTNIDQNRYNTHLRKELIAMYQEKQRTLQNLMKEVKS